MSLEKKLFVGVERKPDGTLDFSRAMEYKKTPEKKPPSNAMSEQELEESRRKLDELWRKSEEHNRKKKEAEMEALHKKLGVESQTEQQKSREKTINTVLQDGGIRIFTSVPQNLSSTGYAGFGDLSTRIQDGHMPSSALKTMEHVFLSRNDVNQGKTLKNVLVEEHGIREIIDIRPEMKEVYEESTIKGRKGVFGVGSTPDRIERKATGKYQPVLHSEIVSAGKNEPAVRITYQIPQTEWRDYTGRQGQCLSVEIVLPESIARAFSEQLIQDPALIRKVVEKVMKEKLLKDTSAWETPQGKGDSLKPPYEKWDALPNGGRIYIQDGGQGSGFQENCVHKVKQ